MAFEPDRLDMAAPMVELRIMDVPTTALDWIFKAGSLGGLLAFGWQLLKAYDERVGRLEVVTCNDGEGGLVAIVKYRPKGSHVGLKVRATAISPPGATVAGTGRRPGTPVLREAIERAIKEQAASKTGEARLSQHAADPQGVYSADIIVRGLVEAEPTAVVDFEVWTVGHARRLARRRLKISAIDGKM